MADVAHGELPQGGGRPAGAAAQVANPAEGRQAGAGGGRAQRDQQQRERDERGVAQIGADIDAANAAERAYRQQQAQQNENQGQNRALQAEAGGEEERRLDLGRLHEGVLNRTMLRFLRARTMPAYEGASVEVRRKSWWRRILRLPLIGALVPGQFDAAKIQAALTVPAGAGAFVPGIAEGAKIVAKGVLQGTLPVAATAAVLGFGARATIDGIRAAVLKRSSVYFLADSIINESTNHRKSWDRKAAWGTVFGNKGDAADLAQLRYLGQELANADQLGMDKTAMRNLIRKAFAMKLDRETLARVLPVFEQQKLSDVELAHLAQIDQTYDIANQMLQGQFTARERMEFMENELPGYVKRREFVNTLKVIGKRSLIAGFKTSILGSAVSIFRGLALGGVIERTAANLSTAANQAYINTQQALGTVPGSARTALDNLTKNLTWPDLSKLGLTAPVAAAVPAAAPFIGPVRPPVPKWGDMLKFIK